MDQQKTDEFKRAINDLYPRLHRAMTAYLAGSSVEADDILQETFLKAYRSLESFEGKSGHYTWLYAIARNLSLDEFRKRKIEKKISTVTVDDLELESDTFESESDKEDILLLRKAIAELPELLRSIVVMKTIDGMNYAEIEEITGVNEQTLKNRMFRARKELAALINQMRVEE
jgi:RNA polymerase sigma-70 factor, ECF subfamily